MTVERNIFLSTGSLFTDVWIATNADGSVMDLTDFIAFYGQMRTHPVSATAFDFTVANTGDPTLGQVKITMLPSVTGTITGSYTDHYVYDVTAKDASGDIVVTLFKGSVFVSRGVTNTA